MIIKEVDYSLRKAVSAGVIAAVFALGATVVICVIEDKLKDKKRI